MIKAPKEKISVVLYLAAGILFAISAVTAKKAVFLPETSRSVYLIFPTLILISAVFLIPYWLRHTPSRFLIEASTALVGAMFLFLPPIASGESLTTLLRVKISALTHTNPYLIAPSQFPADAWSAGTIWRHIPMPFGPLWPLFTIIFTPLAAGKIFFALAAYKAVLGAAALFAGRLLYAIAEKIGIDGKRAELLFLWNPFVLLAVFSDAHNDIVMMLFFLVAVYFLLEDNFTAAFLLLASSALLKYATILALPFFILYAYRKTKSGHSIFKAALPSLILPVLLFYPFWRGGYTFRGLLLASSIISPNSFIVSAAQAFGLGASFLSQARELAWGAALVALLLIFGWSVKKEGRIIKAVIFSFLAAILSLTNLPNWYLLWPMALVPLWGSKKAPRLLIFLTIFGIIHLNRAFWTTALISVAIFGLVVLFENQRQIIARLCQKKIFGKV